jgi:hypothetical protein
MSEGTEHQPLIIYIDRGKFLKTNVAIFLLGGGLTILAFAPWHHAKGNTNILVWFARALLLVWGWFYAPILPWLLFPKPVVMVNDEGISYRPPRIGPFGFGGSLYLSTHIRQMADGLNDHLAIWIGCQPTRDSVKGDILR